jgi:hypothetical protein
MQRTNAKVDENNFITPDDEGQCTIMMERLTPDNAIFLTPCRCAFLNNQNILDLIRQSGQCHRCFNPVEAIFTGLRAAQPQTRSIAATQPAAECLWESPVLAEILILFINNIFDMITTTIKSNLHLHMQALADYITTTAYIKTLNGNDERLSNCEELLHELLETHTVTETRQQSFWIQKISTWLTNLHSCLSICRICTSDITFRDKVLRIIDTNIAFAGLWHTVISQDVPLLANDVSDYDYHSPIWKVAHTIVAHTLTNTIHLAPSDFFMAADARLTEIKDLALSEMNAIQHDPGRQSEMNLPLFELFFTWTNTLLEYTHLQEGQAMLQKYAYLLAKLLPKIKIQQTLRTAILKRKLMTDTLQQLQVIAGSTNRRRRALIDEITIDLAIVNVEIARDSDAYDAIVLPHSQ